MIREFDIGKFKFLIKHHKALPPDNIPLLPYFIFNYHILILRRNLKTIFHQKQLN